MIVIHFRLIEFANRAPRSIPCCIVNPAFRLQHDASTFFAPPPRFIMSQHQRKTSLPQYMTEFTRYRRWKWHYWIQDLFIQGTAESFNEVGPGHTPHFSQNTINGIMSTIEAEQTRRRIHKQRGWCEWWWWRWIEGWVGLSLCEYAAVSDAVLLKGGSE